MANGTVPGALPGRRGAPGGKAKRGNGPAPFDADGRRAARESSPVTIGGVAFNRRRKDWDTNLAMRSLMREQEQSVALSNRLAVRVQELEAEQLEHAAKGETEPEAELEATIRELLAKADAATVTAERTTYRLLALLLAPPEAAVLEPAGAHDYDDAELEAERARIRAGFGVRGDDEGDDSAAVEWLFPELDLEDALDLARELAGQREPDPQTTQSSGDSSS